MQQWRARDPSEVNQEILELFNQFDSYRQQYDLQAIENYKLFIGWKKEVEEGRSNLHIPKTYQIIDTIRSRIFKNFFESRPYVEFQPQATVSNFHNLEAEEEKAKVAAALCDMQLEKNKIVKKFYDYITSYLIFPAAVLGVGWRYEQKYVRKKVPVPNIVFDMLGRPIMQGMTTQVVEGYQKAWDDNEITNIDYFDFWIDPEATDIDSARGVFHREWLTREELEQRLQFLQQMNEGVIYPVKLDEISNSNQGQEQGRWQRLAEVGREAGVVNAYSNNPALKGKEAFEVLHYWEDNRHSMLINRQEVIYDGPSPYWRHQKKPFVFSSYDPLPNEIYGLSAVDVIHDLQHEINTQHNQRMDNVNFVLNKMWKVRRGADVDENQLVSRPGGVVEVDDIHNDIEPMDHQEIPSSAFASESAETANLESVLGTPPIMQGATGDTSKTATEAAQKASNAGLRFDVKIKLFENIGIKRLAMLMDLNNQQFIDDQRLVKVGIKEATEWKQVGPAELLGEFDYSPSGANSDITSNKNIRREQLTNMMMTLMKLIQVPQIGARIKIEELIREWIESFDLRNPEKFFKSEQEMKMQLLQQMAALQGQGQTGQQPNIAGMAASQRHVSTPRPHTQQMQVERRM